MKSAWRGENPRMTFAVRVRRPQGQRSEEGYEHAARMDMKPSELAAKYGVEATESDSENDDFGPDSPIQQKEAKAEAKDGSSAMPADFDWSQAALQWSWPSVTWSWPRSSTSAKASAEAGVMLVHSHLFLDSSERLLDVMEGQDVEPVDARA